MGRGCSPAGAAIPRRPKKEKARRAYDRRAFFYVLAESLVVAIAAVVFQAVVAAVTIAVRPAVTIRPIVAAVVVTVAIAVIGIAEDAMLKPADAAVDRHIFALIQAVASRPAKAALNFPRFLPKVTGLTLGNPVAAVETRNALLQTVDANLQTANRAVAIVVTVAVVAVVVAIALAVTRLRSILSGRGVAMARAEAAAATVIRILRIMALLVSG